MNFAIISPTAGLQKFSTLSHVHLLLAHVDNPLYWQFYRKLSEDSNQLLILDNGAYEGQMNLDILRQRVERTLRPTCLVLPDFCGTHSEDTFAASQNFLQQHRHEWPIDFMYIPQFDGTIQDYNAMRNHLRRMVEAYGIRWIGLPRIMAERGYSRASLCLWIKDLNMAHGTDTCYVHAFGMCNGSVRELEELRDAGCDSIDSSAPVWRGWNGYAIEATKPWVQNGTPCNFDAHPDTLTPKSEQLILANLRKVGVDA